MVDLSNFTGFLAVSEPRKTFRQYAEMGTNRSLENPNEVGIEEIAPDQVAIFCRLASDWVLLAFVGYGNKKSFDYYKGVYNDRLIVAPLAAFQPPQPASPKPVFSARKRSPNKPLYDKTPYWIEH